MKKIVSLGLVLWLIGVGAVAAFADTVTPEYQNQILHNLDCHTWVALGNGRGYKIQQGDITNDGATARFWPVWDVTVFVNVYDQNHVRIDQGIATTSGLRIGETWHFTASAGMFKPPYSTCEVTVDINGQ
jgi:hypothetical protein